MSNPKTPTYDKSHYSWQAPSSQASQAIIEDADPDASTASTGIDKASYFDKPATEPSNPEVIYPPSLPRRSTFNYEQESEEYHKSAAQDNTGPDATTSGETDESSDAARKGSISSKPFKPSAKRTKSWDYRDKRGELQMSMMRDAGTPKESEGFSEV